MPNLMRCLFCGLLQDEPAGVKQCARCGGELIFENERVKGQPASCISVQMELDQIFAPSGQMVDRFVLFTLRSPKEVPEEFRQKGTSARPSINFNPVLDRSGSMHGQKNEFARQAIVDALKYLNQGDTFSLVAYDDEISFPFPSQKVSAEFLKKAADAIRKIQPGGSTALHAGLEAGIDQAHKNSRESNLVLLLSDGLANVGITDLEIIGQSAKKARQQGILVSTIGVGLDYNEALMTQVAMQGGGRFYHIDIPQQIPAIIAGELGEAANWSGKDLEIHLRLPAGASAMTLTEVYPLSISGTEAILAVGNIPCDTTLEIPLRVSFPPQKPDARLRLDGDVCFTAPSGKLMEIPLNPVTVRVVEKSTFQISSGVVEAVLLRVLHQRKSANLVNIKQVMFSTSLDAIKEEKSALEELREYASRLGNEKAKQELEELEMRFSDLHGPSYFSKTTISDSYISLRGQKQFWKDRDKK